MRTSIVFILGTLAFVLNALAGIAVLGFIAWFVVKTLRYYGAI